MKKIVLVALLAAAGCGSKKGSDCSAAIGKGIDGYVATATKTASPGLQGVLKIGAPLKVAMTQRCIDDKWQPDAIACYGNATSSDDLKACGDKLSREQRTRLDAAVFPITMGGMGSRGSRMPPGLEGHPPMLRSNADPAAPAADSAGSAAPGSAATTATPVAPAPAPAPAPTPAGSGSN